MPSSHSARKPPPPSDESQPSRSDARNAGLSVSFPIPADVIDGVAETIAHRTLEVLRDRLEAESPWLTTEEAAEYLRVPLGTFRERAAKGEFDAIAKQEGRRVYYHRSDLDVHRREYVRKAGSDLAGPR